METTCKNATMAIKLIDLGHRPLEHMTKKPYSVNREILAARNRHVLKHAFEVEPPTKESLDALIRCLGFHNNEALAFLIPISGKLPGHKERMSSIARDAASHFIFARDGRTGALPVLEQAMDAGGTLTCFPPYEFAVREPRRIWHHIDVEEQDENRTDLMAHLIQRGFRADADLLRQSRHAKQPQRRKRAKA